MTAHTPAVSHDQPPLPNQHFSSWLRGQTTLFISQIVAVLGIVLFIAEEVYYVSHFREQSELLEPLTIKLIVDCAHVAFMAVFILVLIQVLDDNERNSHRVKQVYERVFGKHGVDYEHALGRSKEQLKIFKRHFLRFWIGMLFLYVFFACQHSFELATKHPEQAAHAAHGVSHTSPNANEGHDDKEEKFKAEVKYNDTGREGSLKAELSYERVKEAESTGLASESPPSPTPAASHGSETGAVWRILAFPFIVFFFNNLTQLFVFWCFLVLWIPFNEMGAKYKKYRNGSFIIVGVLTFLFPLLAWVKAAGHTPVEWDAFIAVFDALSGVINAVALALLIARLDSKLVGLPSWLISILYSYAAVQPLFMVFSLSQSLVLEKIATSVLIFVFISKIYFFLIIIYALQTGKMLNYLFCFPILRERAKADNRELRDLYYLLTAARALRPWKVPYSLFFSPVLRGRAEADGVELSEGRLMRLCTRCTGWVWGRLSSNRKRRIRKTRKRRSLWLRSGYPLKISARLGLVTICFFFIYLIYSLITQSNSFSADDLTGPDNLAVRLHNDFIVEQSAVALEQRIAHGPVPPSGNDLLPLFERNLLSAYLREKLPSDVRRQLDDYDPSTAPPESLNKALVEQLNQALGDSTLFDVRRFNGVNLKEEARTFVKQSSVTGRPQGDALLHFNRLLLEGAYPLEIAEHPQSGAGEGWRAALNPAFDCIQLLFVSWMIVTVYLLREENGYGGSGALRTGERIFGYVLKHRYPPGDGKKLLKKFKEYFLYFWCAMFLLYVVFLLDHLGVSLCSDEKGSVAVTSRILWSVSGCAGTPAPGSVPLMLNVLLYPFLEFSLGTLNLMFVFWCFIVMRSPAFDRRAVMRQKMLVNHSAFVVALLIAVFPLLLFWIGGPTLSESDMRDYATVFNGVTGMLSAIVLALLIARMDSKLFGLPSWSIGMLFAYASIQPLVVAFALNDTVLRMVQTSVLITALGLKICFFLIIAHSLQSGRALNYLLCFPFLKNRVDSIFENQFEIRLAKGDAHSFSISILKKNHLQYSVEKRFKSRKRCDMYVSGLRRRMKDRDSYLPPREGRHPNARCHEELGTYWVELRSKGKLLCESISLKTEEEVQDLIAESIEKIPYCKYTRT